MSCPACGSEDVKVVETSCLDTEWGEPNGEVLAFHVCASCDYGINAHTEGLCECAKEKV
jgi:hypothetical protein